MTDTIGRLASMTHDDALELDRQVWSTRRPFLADRLAALKEHITARAAL